MKTDVGDIIDMQKGELSWVMHRVRESQKRYLCRRVPATRNDLGNLAHAPVGADVHASCSLLRKRGPKRLKPMQRAFLTGLLAGATHTQQRMARGKLAADMDPVCPFCGEAEETQEHAIWHCPAFEKHRKRLVHKFQNVDTASWPPSARHCGIFEQDERLIAEKVQDAAVEPAVFFLKDFTETDAEAVHYTSDRRIMVATDGACADQAHELLARAGQGIFYGYRHSQNHSERIYGYIQNAYRAEVAALAFVARTCFAPVLILCDNLAAAQLFQHFLDTADNQKPDYFQYANSDFWEVVVNSIAAKGKHYFQIKHIPSHLGTKGVDEGRLLPIEEYLNTGADILAQKGAKSHPVPPEVRREALNRVVYAELIQSTAIEILEARRVAKPLESRAAGFNEVRKNQFEENWDDASQHIEQIPDSLVDLVAEIDANNHIFSVAAQNEAGQNIQFAEPEDEDPFGFGFGFD